VPGRDLVGPLTARASVVHGHVSSGAKGFDALMLCCGGWEVSLIVHGVKDLWPLEREDDPGETPKDIVNVRQHTIQQPVFDVDAAIP
jgi:hypothetical protein